MRLAVLLAFANLALAQQSVTVCQLREQPWKFHKKSIVVEGFAFAAFESSTLQDPGCDKPLGIWREYDSERPEVIPTVQNAKLEELSSALHHSGGAMVKVRLRGRFFAGTNGQLRGFGHLNCCSLLAVQEVLMVHNVSRPDLDPNSYTRDFFSRRNGCNYAGTLKTFNWGPKILAEQREAENFGEAWRYDSPERVALEAISQLVPGSNPQPQDLFIDHAGTGRMEYSWHNPSDGDIIKPIISKPAWLSHFAKDPQRTPWLAVAVSRETCGR